MFKLVIFTTVEFHKLYLYKNFLPIYRVYSIISQAGWADQTSGVCEQFHFDYESCRGNKNRFETEEECYQVCRGKEKQSTGAIRVPRTKEELELFKEKDAKQALKQYAKTIPLIATKHLCDEKVCHYYIVCKKRSLKPRNNWKHLGNKISPKQLRHFSHLTYSCYSISFCCSLHLMYDSKVFYPTILLNQKFTIYFILLIAVLQSVPTLRQNTLILRELSPLWKWQLLQQFRNSATVRLRL